MRGKKNIKLIGAILILILVIYLAYSLNNSFINKKINIYDSESINRGQGWTNNVSKYSGSEMGFKLSNSNEITFSFVSDSDAAQGIEIFINNIKYIISAPNLNDQSLTINLNKDEEYIVRLRHFCEFFDHPCIITLKGIYTNRNSKVIPFESNKKMLTILGDSISTHHGKNNYSFYLADSLQYQLHNASIIGSTLSKVDGLDNVIDRYENDIKKFKSDDIIIFLGSNDASSNIPLDKFEEDYSEMIKNITKWHPNSEVYIVGILPRKDVDSFILNKYNDVLIGIANKYSLKYIETNDWLDQNDYSDDVHPSLESQKELANHFQEILKSDLE